MKLIQYLIACSLLLSTATYSMTPKKIGQARKKIEDTLFTSINKWKSKDAETIKKTLNQLQENKALHPQVGPLYQKMLARKQADYTVFNNQITEAYEKAAKAEEAVKSASKVFNSVQARLKLIKTNMKVILSEAFINKIDEYNETQKKVINAIREQGLAKTENTIEEDKEAITEIRESYPEDTKEVQNLKMYIDSIYFANESLDEIQQGKSKMGIEE